VITEEEILEVLQLHQGSATEFCVGCKGFRPPREQLETWDTEGIARHQAAKIYEAIDYRAFVEGGC
jgi:hypothetical protein